MKKVRKDVFETNSSSTHALSITNGSQSDYLSPSSTLVVDFIDTDDCGTLCTLKEKVSYLVSQIVNKYKWDVYDYEDLKEQVEHDWDFQRISLFVKEKYNKNVVLPKNHKVNRYKGEDGEEYNDLEDIVNINHQIQYSDLDELLSSLVNHNRDLLEEVLRTDTIIEFGRD
jgi:hypothetical protein